MATQKEEKAKLEAMLAGAISSQIPINITKESYSKMLSHGRIEQGVWACHLGGAPIKARMVRRNVFDRTTGELLNTGIPVAELYCSRCHTVPATKKGTAIYSDLLKTYYA